MKVSTEDTPVPIHFPRLQKEHSIVTIVGVEENDEPAPTGKRIYATPPQGGKALGPRESSTSTILGTQELQALVHSSQGGPTGEQFVEVSLPKSLQIYNPAC